MATIVKESDCTFMTLTSDIITDFIANAGATHTIQLTTTYNGGDDIVKALSLVDLDQPNNSYIILPALYSMTTTLSDGIYYLLLEEFDIVTELRTRKETLCIFMDCETSCCVLTVLSKDPNTEAVKYLAALTVAEICSDCNCDDAVTIFDALNGLINITDKTSVTNDCGCG